MRIGIAGYATAGKDVVADVLVHDYGFTKVNMSDALDRYLLILNPYIMTDNKKFIRYATYRQSTNYVAAKRNPEVRRLLQTLGTEVGRAIDPNMWVKELEKEAAKHRSVVTTGIRYAEEITEDMFLVYVERPHVGPLNDHSSENLDWVKRAADWVIDNDGSIEQLHDRVHSMMKMASIIERTAR